MPTAAIIGTGLIGASVGLALKEVGWTIVAWDPSPQALEVATERQAADRTASSVSEANERAAVQGADPVVANGNVRSSSAPASSLPARTPP